LYGPTKAAIAWYGLRINAEDEWLNTFTLDPGWTQTEMGNLGAKTFGLSEAPIKVEDSVEGLYKVLTTATKEKYGGKLVEYTGNIMIF
jgi:norsolorinic acid ketoreductase